MRRMLLLAVALVLALTGCTTSSLNNSPDNRFVGQWVLVGGSDAHGKIPLGGTYVTLTINQGTAANGRGPCNDYTADIIGQPGPVFVRVTHRSRGLCTDQTFATLDQRYITDLKASTLAAVDGKILTLSSPTTALQFQSVPHFMIGGIVDIAWFAQVETFGDPSGNSYTAQPAGTLLLVHDGSAVMTVGACPAIKGHWITDAGEIVLTQLTGTQSKCYTPDDSANRTAVLEVIANGFQANVSEDTLTTTNPRTLTGIVFANDDDY